jgi:hypothetical protein
VACIRAFIDDPNPAHLPIAIWAIPHICRTHWSCSANGVLADNVSPNGQHGRDGRHGLQVT